MVQQCGGKHLVIAFFASPAAGEVAARALDKQASASGRSGSVGLLTLDKRGKVATAKLGSRTARDGPGVGAVLAVIALALAGGVMPDRGHLFDARSDLSTDDVARFGAELDAGQAAVAVLGQGADAEHAVVELTGLGGKAEVHRLTEQALRQAAAAPAIGSF
jgi:hypothetical protein